MELEYVELRDLITHLFLQHALKFYSLVFDAVYTPKMTRLLKEAEESGATIVKGLEMFIGQAYEQYEKYTGLPGKTGFKRSNILCSMDILVLVPLSLFQWSVLYLVQWF
jgi:shikimate 5-dehydrogenase